MKYYLIAGEASGDMHGANLMRAIMQKDNHAEFRFWGGDKMKEAGGEQVEHYKNTAFMGFWEVITHLKRILNFIAVCKKDIGKWQPDVVILIDYPGFNMRIAQFAKEAGFKVVYYISPQIWAWKESRVHKIKKYVDKMLVILPFEKEFYKKWDYQVEFVGHPLLDEMNKYIPKENEPKSVSGKQIIALLPGSRKQEIKKILPEFLSVANTFTDYHFIIAGLNHIEPEFYQSIIGGKQIEIVYNQTYELLSKSHAALVASGTATLETALLGVPMVVGYKGSYFSYFIGKMLVKIKYIALVNLIMNEPVVTELIQNDLTKENLQNQLQVILGGEERNLMLSKFDILKQKLGKSGASERAATSILKFISA